MTASTVTRNWNSDKMMIVVDTCASSSSFRKLPVTIA